MTIDITGLKALKAMGGESAAKKPHEISGLALAFLGDCVWEILIRQHLLIKGEMKPDRPAQILHPLCQGQSTV